ncbi:TPA: hypothetical protein EYP44_04720 [Candidatus Bathyarchaeota archaeon]|nr:hypothetical protein [Candidatus Bathyarchaeota archaeon]
MKNAISFTIHEKGEGEHLVFGICEGNPAPLTGISRAFSLAQKQKKKSVLAIVNRQGEVVYYSINGLLPKPTNP